MIQLGTWQPMPRPHLCLALLTLVALAGCGGDARPAAERAAEPRPTPAAYPVAYAVDRGELDELAERSLPEALEGRKVVATSTWEPYTLVVLSEWLHEKGIELDPPPALAARANAIGEAWDAPVFVIAAEHARRYGKRLARLRPPEAELQRFFESFTEEPRGTAGQEMAEWLDVVRRSVSEARGDRVVVIPVEE